MADWREQAACRGHDPVRFFLDAFEPLAKRTCEQCPVRPQCQDIGMREEFGVFGGLNPRERERVRNKRKPSAVRRAA